MCAVIGQFSGLYYTVRSAKFKSFFNVHAKYQRYNKYLTNLVFLVSTVSYRSLFYSARIYGHALHAWAINLSRKNLVHNLQYGPRTQ